MSDESRWARDPDRFLLAQAYHLAASVIGWDAAVEFGLKVWELKRPPSTATTNALHGGGRGVIYIPRTINGLLGRGLVALVGVENARKLARTFGGEHLEFPSIAKTSVGRRNRAISARIAEGAKTHAVAVEFDLSEQHVRRIAKANFVRKEF